MGWDDRDREQRRAIRERSQAARTRATQVLAVSAGLALRHAEAAEKNGDLESAQYERAVASRVWAAVERYVS